MLREKKRVSNHPQSRQHQIQPTKRHGHRPLDDQGKPDYNNVAVAYAGTNSFGDEA